MKNIAWIIGCMLLIGFSSCQEESLPTESLGELSYYPSFGPWKADTTSLTRTFHFDFNEDAKSEGEGVWAEFQFVDNEGTPVPTSVLEIMADGEVLNDNCFRVNSTESVKVLTFRFQPAAEGGKHQGNLRMVRHNNLQRIDNQILDPGQSTDIFKWTLYFEKDWNPVAKGLTIVAAIILALLLVWFLLIRPLVVKKLKVFNLTIIEPYFSSIYVNGARRVVFTAEPRKQGLLNRIFLGKIIYEINPAWEHEWMLEPSGNGAIIIAPHHYVDPIDSPLEPGTEYKLEDSENPRNIAKISV